jgi:hypothetical protein
LIDKHAREAYKWFYLDVLIRWTAGKLIHVVLLMDLAQRESKTEIACIFCGTTHIHTNFLSGQNGKGLAVVHARQETNLATQACSTDSGARSEHKLTSKVVFA